MSANNQLIISRDKKKWKIIEVDVDTNESYRFNFPLFSSLEEAVKFANGYCHGNELNDGQEVEYGYRIEI